MGGEAGEEGPREREGRLGRRDRWGGGAVGGEAGEERPRQPEDLRTQTDWGDGEPCEGRGWESLRGRSWGLSRGGVVP